MDVLLAAFEGQTSGESEVSSSLTLREAIPKERAVFFPELAKIAAGHEHEFEVSDGVSLDAFRSNVKELKHVASF